MSDREASNAIVSLTGFYAAALARAEEKYAALLKQAQVLPTDPVTDQLVVAALRYAHEETSGPVFEASSEASLALTEAANEYRRTRWTPFGAPPARPNSVDRVEPAAAEPGDRKVRGFA